MPKKSLYRIRNWKQYNASLVARGSITVWISPDARQGWLYQGSKKQGHPFKFSNTAIKTALIIRAIYHLPLRQTEGFLLSIFDLLQIKLPVPDYTTLSKRTTTLTVNLPLKENREPINLVIDSSGLKVYGEGEWKVRMHGKSKRRAWRKIHLGINPLTKEIEAEELAPAFANDARFVAPLLARIDKPIRVVALDSAYDQHHVYNQLKLLEAIALIPPRHQARITKHGNSVGPPLQRDEIIRAIRRNGRKRWKISSGYHMRSIAENAMYRQKIIFGANLRNRRFASQKTEFSIRCLALNLMTHLGMPESVKVS